MLVYTFFYGILLCFACLDFNNKAFSVHNKEFNAYNNFLFLLLLFLFVVFRIDCGYDFSAYKEHYGFINESTGLYIQFEPLFVLLNRLAPTFTFLLIFIFGISVLLKYEILRRNSSNFWLTFFIYYCSYFLLKDFGQIRQACAITFALLCLLEDNSKKRKLIFIVLAMLFHYTAFVLLFSFIIPRKHRGALLYIMILLISFVFSKMMETFLILLFSKLSLGIITGKASLYFNSEQATLSYSLLLYRIFVFALSYFLLREKKYVYLSNCYFYAIIIQILFTRVPQISGICGQYFAVTEILLIPAQIKAIKSKNLKPFLFGIYIISSTIMYFKAFSAQTANQILPYKNLLLSGVK